MKKEEVLFLSQLVKSVEEAVEKLEKFYRKKDYQNFNKSKKTIMGIQQEISNALT
jgi:uncharacterized protein with HEPN domain